MLCPLKIVFLCFFFPCFFSIVGLNCRKKKLWELWGPKLATRHVDSRHIGMMDAPIDWFIYFFAISVQPHPFGIPGAVDQSALRRSWWHSPEPELCFDHAPLSQLPVSCQVQTGDLWSPMSKWNGSHMTGKHWKCWECPFCCAQWHSADQCLHLYCLQLGQRCTARFPLRPRIYWKKCVLVGEWYDFVRKCMVSCIPSFRKAHSCTEVQSCTLWNAPSSWAWQLATQLVLWEWPSEPTVSTWGFALNASGWLQKRLASSFGSRRGIQHRSWWISAETEHFPIQLIQNHISSDWFESTWCVFDSQAVRHYAFWSLADPEEDSHEGTVSPAMGRDVFEKTGDVSSSLIRMCSRVLPNGAIVCKGIFDDKNHAPKLWKRRCLLRVPKWTPAKKMLWMHGSSKEVEQAWTSISCGPQDTGTSSKTSGHFFPPLHEGPFSGAGWI